MSPVQWSRIEALFHSLALLPDRDRDLALQQALESGESEEIVREVRRLVGDLDASRSYLERPPEGVSLLGKIQRGGSSETWPAGTVLAGRFRIEGRIGSGGMGDVYSAWDEKLGVRVALKCLPTGWWNDPEMQERFHREIALARHVTHPNVCRIFDFSEHQFGADSIPLLTMEYLEGETLAVRLKCGRFTPDALMPLARQLFDGLAAAHRAGIVHRDLKPSNIMLVGGQDGERLIILDFGTARDIKIPEHTLTTSGALLGTLGYMAPEQLRGTSDARSDLFSAGLILYEALAGEPPFGPVGTVSSVVRRLTEPVEPPARRIPGLPSNWQRLLQSCLEREPARRPASAEAARNILMGRWIARAPRFTRRHLAWIGAGGLAMSLFPVARRYLESKEAVVSPGSLCMLAPLQNGSGDGTLDTLPGLVRTQLTQSRRLEVWDKQRLPAVLDAMRRKPSATLDDAGWREAAKREDVALLVFSSLSQPGGEYVWNLRLERMGPAVGPAESRTMRAESKAGLLEKTRDAANWIRERAGETATEVASASRPTASITSESLEAIHLFDQSEQAVQPVQNAILLLKEAVRIDPGFSLALMRLGDRLTSIRRLEEGLPYWKSALEQARRQRLTLREELRLQSLYAFEVWDFPACEASSSRWISEFVEDGEAHYVHFSCLLNQGDLAQARSALGRFPLNARWNVLRLQARAAVELCSGQAQDLASTAGELLSRGRTGTGHRYLGVSHVLRGDAGSAEAEFRKMTVDGDASVRSRGFVNLAALLAHMGRWSEAEQTLRQGERDDENAAAIGFRAEKLASLAFLAWRQNKAREARALALDAVGVEPSSFVTVQSVTVLARAGFVADAERLEARFRVPVEAPRFEWIRRRMRGEILLARGRIGDGLAEMEAAARLDIAVLAPEYKAWALRCAGENGRLERMAAAFERQPSQLWIFPEHQFPGMAATFKEKGE